MPKVEYKKSMTKLLATKEISYSDILDHQKMVKCSNCDGELLTFFRTISNIVIIVEHGLFQKE